MTIFFSFFEYAQHYLTPAEFSLENLTLNVLEADGGRRDRRRLSFTSPRGRFVLLNCSKAGEAADLLGSPPLFWVKEQVATGVFCKPLHFLCYLGCLGSIFNLHSDCLFRIEHVSRKYTVFVRTNVSLSRFMGNWSFLWHDVNTDHIMSRAMTGMKCTREHDADQLPRYFEDLHQAKRTKKTLDSSKWNINSYLLNA